MSNELEKAAENALEAIEDYNSSGVILMPLEAEKMLRKALATPSPEGEPAKIFEVLTKHGDKFRYDDTSLHWQYGIKSGTLDVDDKTSVEIVRTYGDGDYDIIQRINDVVRVGDVCASTTLEHPRQVMMAQCEKSVITQPQPVPTPQTLKRLKDNDIVEIRKSVVGRYIRADVVGKKYGESIAFARAIESAMKGEGDE